VHGRVLVEEGFCVRPGTGATFAWLSTLHTQKCRVSVRQEAVGSSGGHWPSSCIAAPGNRSGATHGGAMEAVTLERASAVSALDPAAARSSMGRPTQAAGRRQGRLFLAGREHARQAPVWGMCALVALALPLLPPHTRQILQPHAPRTSFRSQLVASPMCCRSAAYKPARPRGQCAGAQVCRCAGAGGGAGSEQVFALGCGSLHWRSPTSACNMA